MFESAQTAEADTVADHGGKAGVGPPSGEHGQPACAEHGHGHAGGGGPDAVARPEQNGGGRREEKYDKPGGPRPAKTTEPGDNRSLQGEGQGKGETFELRKIPSAAVG